MLFINIKESWVHLDWLTKCYQWQDKILTATIHLLHFYLIQVSQKKVFVLLWFHVTWEPRLQKQNTFLNLPGIKKKNPNNNRNNLSWWQGAQKRFSHCTNIAIGCYLALGRNISNSKFNFIAEVRIWENRYFMRTTTPPPYWTYINSHIIFNNHFWCTIKTQNMMDQVH